MTSSDPSAKKVSNAKTPFRQEHQALNGLVFLYHQFMKIGRCNTTAELEELRRTCNVSPRYAIIDSGYKANEVYRFSFEDQS